MIAFSVMMWFVSLVLLIVSVSLLKGNISIVHGKVFDKTDDKVGYGKALGKLILIMCLGVFFSGVIAVMIKGSMAIIYAVLVILMVVAVTGIEFVKIQRRFK